MKMIQRIEDERLSLGAKPTREALAKEFLALLFCPDKWEEFKEASPVKLYFQTHSDEETKFDCNFSITRG